MEIIVGELSGFCFGVNNAVSKTEEILKNENEIYCLGELVHNRQVIEKLEKRGLKIIEKIESVPNKSRLILRAHGVPPKVYNMVKEKEIKLYDFTCPKVLKIHEEVSKAKEESYIFIIGEKNHPEVIGTKGFSGEKSFVIQSKEDIEEAIKSLKESKLKKLYIVVQTTFSVQKYNEIMLDVSEKLKEYEIEINKSICDSTRLRQEETTKISKTVDYMIIVGGKNSSNTKKLYDIAQSNCQSTHIQTKEELNLEKIKKYKKIGITAGASTPKESIKEVVELLERI